jgi:hypothetical protein
VTGYLLFAVMGGAPNSPLTTPLPRGARPPAWTARLATILRMQHLGRRGVIAAALILMALLLIAFALLVVEARAQRVRPSLVIVASALSIAIVTFGPLLLSRDVFSYAIYGRIAAVYHQDPYLSVPAAFRGDPFVPVLARQWLHARSPYGPVFTLIGAAIVGARTGSVGAAILGFKILAGAGVMIAVLLTAWSARATRPERAALAASIVGLNPVVVIHTVGGGHADALIAATLAGALWLAVLAAPRPARRVVTTAETSARGDVRSWTTTLAAAAVTTVLTLSCMTKIVVVPALALWLWWVLRAAPRSVRLRSAALHLGVVTLISILLYGPFLSSWRAVATVPTQAGREVWASASSLVGRGARAVVGSLAGSGAGVVAGRTVVAGSLLAVAALVWLIGSRGIAWYAPRPPALRGPVDGWGGALLLLALAGPFLLPWYAMWFVVFLGLMEDEAQMWIGVTASCLLALTLIPADPPQGITTWGVMLGVHYVVAPMMLCLLIAMVVRTIRVPGHPVSGM